MNNIKLLYLCSRFPWPLLTGDRVRAFNQIKVLSVKFDVYLICLTDDLPSQEDLDMIQPLCKQIHIYILSKTRRYISLIGSLFNSMPLQTAYFYSPVIKNKIERDLAEIEPDIIFTQLIRMAPYSLKFAPKAQIDIMDSSLLNNLPARKLSKIANIIIGNWQRTKELSYVHKLISLYSKSYIISDRDRQSYEASLQAKLILLPNGVDYEYFKKVKAYSNQIIDFGFIGNLNYEPNVLAVDYIINQIFSHLDARYTCLIGGIGAEKLKINSNQGIILKSEIDDIRKYYQSIKIFIAPIFTGSGVQNKVLEAMAQGIPVICSSFVNEAIGATIGRDLLLADSAKEFAEKINCLLDDEDLYSHLRKNGRLFVIDKYNWYQQTQIS